MYVNCKQCFVSFDPAMFGTGRDYCSAKCRNYKSMQSTAGIVGQPRRFPLATPEHKEMILKDLIEKRGWRISQRNPDKNRYLGTKNSMQLLRFTFGSGQLDEKYSHICAFVRDETVYYHSTCTRGAKAVPKTDVEKQKQRIPCGNCKKCNMYNWFCEMEHLRQKSVAERSPIELAFHKHVKEREQEELDASRERLEKMQKDMKGMSEPQKRAYRKNQPEDKSEYEVDDTALS